MKEGWKCLKLGDVCKIYNGNSINADYKKKFYEGLKEGYPFIATKDVSFIGSIDYNNGVRIPFVNELKRAFPGSVFICAEGGSAGKKIAYIEKEVCFGNKLFCLQPKTKDLLGKYLYYYLNSESFQYQFKERLTGLIGGVSSKKFNDITICIFDKEDQQRIVSYLDTSFAKIDALAKQAEESLENAKALFQATLKELMEKKEGWEEKKIKEIGTIKIGPFGSLLHKKDYIKGGVPLINPMHIINGEIIANMSYTTSVNKAAEMINYQLHAEDLIIGRRGEMGRCAIVQNHQAGFLCGTGCMIITNYSKTIEPLFLKLLLSSDFYKKKLEDVAGGATMPNLSSKSLGSVEICIPPLSEQSKIVTTLDTLSEKVAQLQSNYTQTLANCQALKQALLRQVFE